MKKIQEEEDEAIREQIKLEKKMRMEAAKMRYEEKIARKIQYQQEKIALRKSADEELRKSLEQKRKQREKNTMEMQKKMIEAKKKFDERRREQSLSPQKDRKIKASKNIGPQKKSEKFNTVPKPEVTNSPMSKHQLARLQKRLKKDKKDIQKFVEKNRDLLSSSGEYLKPQTIRQDQVIITHLARKSHSG